MILGFAVVGEASSSKVQISPSLEVVNSPGTKPGTRVLCERVDVHGFPRLKNLNKFFHSLMLKISPSNSTLRRPIVEVCFHRWVFSSLFANSNAFDWFYYGNVELIAIASFSLQECVSCYRDVSAGRVGEGW
jgi:hypothetical protein